MLIFSSVLSTYGVSQLPAATRQMLTSLPKQQTACSLGLRLHNEHHSTNEAHAMFTPPKDDSIYLSRIDVNDPLASYSKHGFELDDAYWPSVEHYFQAMKFTDVAYREKIRQAEHPEIATKLGNRWFKPNRSDWKAIRETIMTRAVYTKCRTHSEVAQALLATGDKKLMESSLYDYFWGCGRDRRGKNAYGEILMRVRKKLQEEQVQATGG